MRYKFHDFAGLSSTEAIRARPCHHTIAQNSFAANRDITHHGIQGRFTPDRGDQRAPPHTFRPRRALRPYEGIRTRKRRGMGRVVGHHCRTPAKVASATCAVYATPCIHEQAVAAAAHARSRARPRLVRTESANLLASTRRKRIPPWYASRGPGQPSPAPTPTLAQMEQRSPHRPHPRVQNRHHQHSPTPPASRTTPTRLHQRETLDRQPGKT